MSRLHQDSPYTFGLVAPEVWDHIVSVSPQASVFNHRDFLAALGTQIRFWGVFEGQQLQAAICIQTGNQGEVIGPDTSFNFYQGILLSPEIAALPSHSRIRRELAIVNRLLEGLTATYDRFWLCTHPGFTDIRALQWFNYHDPGHGLFQIDVRYTGILALKGFASRDDLVSSFARGRQSDYKKALAKGITVKSCFDEMLMDKLHAKTFARQDADRGSLDRQVAPLTKAAFERGFGELLVAYTTDGKPVSAALFIRDDNATYYLFGASDPEYRNTGAATLIVVESLWSAIEKGITLADFVGINSPQRGEYKTSFGAIPVLYIETHWERPIISDLPRK